MPATNNRRRPRSRRGQDPQVHRPPPAFRSRLGGSDGADLPSWRNLLKSGRDQPQISTQKMETARKSFTSSLHLRDYYPVAPSVLKTAPLTRLLVPCQFLAVMFHGVFQLRRKFGVKLL